MLTSQESPIEDSISFPKINKSESKRQKLESIVTVTFQTTNDKVSDCLLDGQV